MICAACHEPTETDPCAACGEGAALGSWRLVEPLGRGASGTTWLAVGADGEEVAIKEILLAGADAKTRELIDREARVLRQLDHPGIPRWIDAFEVGRGRSRALCVVQERIRGVTLAQEMSSRRYRPAEVADLAEELLRILVWLHALSPPVIHRDLKPANVMRREGGGVALIDFGAVRDALKGDLGGSTVAGTFGYMAPEQFAGDATPRTDLYGLGAILVALLTRKEPQSLLDHAHRLVWRPYADVPEPLAAFVDALVAPEPERRPESAARALQDLRRAREAPAPMLAMPVVSRTAPVAPALPSVPQRSLRVRLRESRLAAWIARIDQSRAARRVEQVGSYVLLIVAGLLGLLGYVASQFL